MLFSFAAARPVRCFGYLRGQRHGSLPQWGKGDRLRWMRCVAGGQRCKNKPHHIVAHVVIPFASSSPLRDTSSVAFRDTFPRWGRLIVSLPYESSHGKARALLWLPAGVNMQAQRYTECADPCALSLATQKVPHGQTRPDFQEESCPPRRRKPKFPKQASTLYRSPHKNRDARKAYKSPYRPPYHIPEYGYTCRSKKYCQSQPVFG